MASTTDVIAAPGEADVFQIDLIGGLDYQATVLGGTLPDPAVFVFDNLGNPLFSQDDSVEPFTGIPLSEDPTLLFEAPYTGTYQVAVTDLTGGTGDYSLFVDQAGVPFMF